VGPRRRAQYPLLLPLPLVCGQIPVMFTVWLTNEQKITAEDVSHFEAVGIPTICLLAMTA